MADPNATATQRQFVVRVSGIEGYFSTKTGGGLEAEAAREFDGGSLEPEVLLGPAIPGDLTVGRGYKPARDAAVLADLRRKVRRAARMTISVQPTDRDLVAIGSATVWTAQLRGVNDPDVDANSGDVARLELTFAVEQVA